MTGPTVRGHACGSTASGVSSARRRRFRPPRRHRPAVPGRPPRQNHPKPWPEPGRKVAPPLLASPHRGKIASGLPARHPRSQRHLRAGPPGAPTSASPNGEAACTSSTTGTGTTTTCSHAGMSSPSVTGGPDRPLSSRVREPPPARWARGPSRGAGHGGAAARPRGAKAALSRRRGAGSRGGSPRVSCPDGWLPPRPRPPGRPR